MREIALDHIRVILSSPCCFSADIRGADDKVLQYFDEVLLGDECSWLSLKGVCLNLFDCKHIALTADGLVVSTQDLGGLSKIGLTKAQLLSRGCFEDLSPPVQIHVQMLAKVVCFLSHGGFVSQSMARHVVRSSFPNFADLFNESLTALETYGILRAATLEDMSSAILVPAREGEGEGAGEGEGEGGGGGGGGGGGKTDSCSGCRALWGWVGTGLQDQIHTAIFNFKTRRNSHIHHEGILQAAGGGRRRFSESFSRFVGGKGEGDLRNVYMIARVELVARLNEGLLETYTRLWHRYAAEYFEEVLPVQKASAQVALTPPTHWLAALTCALTCALTALTACVL